jgi:primosomal protein N' (replication factor Y)
VTTRALAAPLDYAGGDDPPEPGRLVRVRVAGRAVRGVVVPDDGAVPHEGALSPIEAVEDGAVPPVLLGLALWIASYYGSTPARALALVLGPDAAPATTTWASALPAPADGPSARRRAILAELAGGPLALAVLVERAGTTAATVRRLARDGLLRLERRPVGPAAVPRVAAPLPTAEQAAAVERIDGLLGRSGGDLLLHGVTGSGKTEVYLAAIERCLALGRSALVLVPEIALTPQIAARILGRFGDRVAILHSGLSDGARAAAHARIRSGDADVVVGARSAVFAPLRRLGLIVIDEEHDPSYKQGDDPRYDARRVAAKRARLEGAVLVLGSATPRAESWHGLPRASLRERVGGPLPRVQVVDLRRDGLYPLSRPLRDGLLDLAVRGGRGILLLNRRGVAPALHCRTCGSGFRCGRCDVSLSLHADGLRCHHCGHAEQTPRACPACGAVDLARLGAGTERVAEAVAELCGPAVAVHRLDADAVARSGALAGTLEAFAAAPAAVLIGTQMVAKGHDFRDLRLAAAIDADQGLAWPDFRSEERTFALLTQLAGRSARLGDPGRVIVQAWEPDVPAVELAARHAVEEFVTGELARRELLGYPPFRHLVRVEVAAPAPDVPAAALRAMRTAVETLLAPDEVLGPAPLFRVRDRHRAQLLVKTSRPARAAAALADVLARQGRALRRACASGVVDVDPQ